MLALAIVSCGGDSALPDGPPGPSPPDAPRSDAPAPAVDAAISDAGAADAPPVTACTNPYPLSPTTGVKIGAIRYDAWSEGDEVAPGPGLATPNMIYLTGHDWFDRVPFYGTISDDGRVRAASDRQEVADREIDYAVSRGIDFFAFLYSRFATISYETGEYRPYDELGNIIHLHRGSYSFDLYKSSTRCNKPKFTLIVAADLLRDYMTQWTAGNWDPAYVWSEVIEDLVMQMDNKLVHRTPDGRPLLIFLNAELWKGIWGGSAQVARAHLDELRAAFVAAGIGDPYIAGVGSAEDIAQAIDEVGYDAVTSYAVVAASPQASGGIKELPFTDALFDMRWFWNRVTVDLKKEIIPTGTAGWDSRPYEPWGRLPWTWYKRATSAELVAQLDAAITFVEDHPAQVPANSILVYAWNELLEGGFLVPTLQHGSQYLDALATYLGRPIPAAVPRLAPVTRPVVTSHGTGCDGNYGIWVVGENFDPDSYIQLRAAAIGGNEDVIANYKQLTREPGGGLSLCLVSAAEKAAFDGDGLRAWVVNPSRPSLSEPFLVKR